MIVKSIEKLKLLLQGKIPAKLDTGKLDNENERELGNKLNQLIDFIRDIHEFVIPLSKGILYDINEQPKNYLASPFKELHSRLLHFTWHAQQVAKGDYSQRLDYMGDFSDAFNSMIVALDQNEKLLKKKIDELEKADSHITKLEGILSICMNCKRIRLDEAIPENQNSWVQIESYISQRSKTKFSHSICPSCVKKLYPEFMQDEV